MVNPKNQNQGPQFVKWFGPLLDALRKLGGSGSPAEVVEQVAEDLNLSDQQLDEPLPSGVSRFKNQVEWARFYLSREGLIGSSRRGVWSLTVEGRAAILSSEAALKIFRKWSKIFAEEKKQKRAAPEPIEEKIAEGTGSVPRDYREMLINVLRNLPSEGFERLCQRLLRECGFIQVTVTGRSGDGGIDGFGMLQINRLVTIRVLFQCKKYVGTVAPSQVRDFRGAMSGRADKGIIITTGSFSAEARREATRDGTPAIELIDGEKLVDMFQELELGLKPVQSFEIEEAFFEEFRTTANEVRAKV